MSEFPWTAFFILEVEEDREETELFWKDLVDELGQSEVAGGASLGKKHALKKYEQFTLNTSCL